MSGWGRGRPPTRARAPAGEGASRERASDPRDANEPSAYQRALGLLVRREHSRKEITRKLVARGVDRDELEPALDTLARQDFQNDERFAAALARSRASAGYGPQRIRAELAMHGLPRDAIAAALDACERDWPASAVELATRRFGGRDLGDPAKRRKAADFLIRRGFDQRDAQAALRALARGSEAQDAQDDGD
jgi:regulatory protein